MPAWVASTGYGSDWHSLSYHPGPLDVLRLSQRACSISRRIKVEEERYQITSVRFVHLVLSVEKFNRDPLACR